jgi:acetyl esterase/lipase
MTDLGLAGALHLDPELAEVLGAFPGPPVDLSDWRIGTIPELRARRAAATPAPTLPPTTTVHRDVVTRGAEGRPAVTLRVYSPPGMNSARPCVFWIHGGGYILGRPMPVDPALDRWVEQLGCVVVAVDYRLAPDHPYPAPLDDCLAGITWTLEDASELGIDPERIALVGASAGGGLAAGLALALRDRGARLPAGLVLVYPMLDDRTAASHGGDDTPVWNGHNNRLGWAAYLGELAGSADVPPYAVPGRAKDLSGLPPTTLAVGTADLFAGETVAFAHRLMAAGVRTELHVYDGGCHGLDTLAPKAAISRRFRRDLTEAVARSLGIGPEEAS